LIVLRRWGLLDAYIDGVFTLGQATKEEIEVINLKTDELRRLQEEGLKKK